MLSLLHHELSNDNVSPSIAVEELVSLLSAHLEHYSVIDHSFDTSLLSSNHRERNCSSKLKNQSRRKFSTSPGKFLSAVKI